MLTPDEITKIRTAAGVSPVASTTPKMPSLSTKLGFSAQATSQSTPAVADKQSFISSSEPSFKASETGKAMDVPSNILKTVGNIPSSARNLVRSVIAPVNPFDVDHPLNVGKNVVESAKAVKDIMSTQGFAAGLKSVLGGFADTYLKVGETIYGGLDKAYNALLDDPKKALADVASEVAKIGIEDPLLIPTLLYTPGKTAGTKGEDIITRLSKIMTKGEDTSLSNIATKTGTAIEDSAAAQMKAQQAEFARELTRPERTATVKKAEVGRTTETGIGPFKKSVVEPTPLEARMADEVSKIEGVSKSNTVQQNYNVVKDYVEGEASILQSELKANDFNYPKKELKARLNESKTTLMENPSLVGDNEKIADKLLNKFYSMLDESSGKGSDLLQLRKDFDSWVSNQKGSNIFDPKTESAYSATLREIRQTINNFLDEKSPTVKVKESLRKQSALYSALDNMEVKAAKEADSAIGRTFQKVASALGTKSKAVQAIAAVVGIGSVAAFAPAVAASTIPIFLMYKAGKLILKPELRVAIGKLLKEAGSALDVKDSEFLNGIITTDDVQSYLNKVGITLDKPASMEGGFAKLPFGEAPRSVTVEKVAKSVDDTDVNIIKKYLEDAGNDPAVYAEVQPIIEGMNISNLDETMQRRFLQEVIDTKSSFKSPTVGKTALKQSALPKTKITVDDVGNYDRAAFDSYIDSIPGEKIPATHETSLSAAKEMLKDGSLDDEIFASLGFRDAQHFGVGKDSVKILFEIPKNDIKFSSGIQKRLGQKYSIGLDTMDHTTSNPFVGNEGHISTVFKPEWIVDIVDASGKSVLSKLK